MNEQQLIISNKWRTQLENKIEDAKTLQCVMAYVDTMIQQKMPIIIGINHLAYLMKIEPSTLKKMVTSSRSFYKTFFIPKRKGGQRKIDAPYPVLLHAQRWIYNQILNKIDVNDHAMGFIKSKSIVNNACVHLGNRCLLLLDIQDFFPSIKWYKVYSIFHKLGYPQNISQYLTSLCCFNGCLPQGAVTSPSLSNIISKRLDARLSALANSFEISYSRYADDITFSGKFISPKFYKIIQTIIEEEGFKLNKEKTRFIYGQHQKIVTGISISSGKPTIPKAAKRQVRQHIYYIRKYGLQSHMNNIQSRDPIYLERLLGYLCFWKSIEPDNHFVKQAIKDLKIIEMQRQKIEIGIAEPCQPLQFDEFILKFDNNL